MSGISQLSEEDRKIELKVPVFVWVFAAVLLVTVATVVLTNLAEAEHIFMLFRQSRPWWLLVALMLQIMTYVCAGQIWYQVARSAGFRPPIGVLASLAIESLSVNQVVPVVGMAGNMVVVRAMKRMGLPYSLAMEAVLVEIISQFIAYAVLCPLTLLELYVHHEVTPVVLWVIAVFAFMMTFGLRMVFRLLAHRHAKPKGWLGRRKIVLQFLEIASHVSPERVRSKTLLTKTSLFYISIFLLDAATLWAALEAVGVSINPLIAFAALVIASMAGTISLLPGGLGSFEAACTAILVLLGVQLEAAIAGTLLLRGFSFWIPLPLGLVLARREMR